MATNNTDGLDSNIVAALDDVLSPESCEPLLLNRLRRLVQNCLADNYDESDVLAVIELAVEAGEDEDTADGT